MVCFASAREWWKDRMPSSFVSVSDLCTTVVENGQLVTYFFPNHSVLNLTLFRIHIVIRKSMEIESDRSWREWEIGLSRCGSSCTRCCGQGGFRRWWSWWRATAFRQSSLERTAILVSSFDSIKPCLFSDRPCRNHYATKGNFPCTIRSTTSGDHFELHAGIKTALGYRERWIKKSGDRYSPNSLF